MQVKTGSEQSRKISFYTLKIGNEDIRLISIIKKKLFSLKCSANFSRCNKLREDIHTQKNTLKKAYKKNSCIN